MANKIERIELGSLWWNSLLTIGLQQKQLEQGVAYAEQGGVEKWSRLSNGSINAVVLGQGSQAYQQQLLFESYSSTTQEQIFQLLLERILSIF